MPLKFQLNSYDLALSDFISKVINGFLGLDPLIGTMYHETVVHTGPTRNVRGPQPLDQEQMLVSSEGTLHREEITNTDNDAFTNFMFIMAQGALDSFGPQMFSGIAELTIVTGNRFDAQGAPFSLTMLNDVLEKMPVEFDAEGNPLLPTVVVSPENFKRISQTQPTKEEEERFNEIINRKRSEYLSKKRTRRLS